MDEKKISNAEKVKALHEHILEECKRQSFTVQEFEMLYLALYSDLSERQYKVYEELF